jgi:hypothetical protein
MDSSKRKGWVVPLVALGMAAVFLLLLLLILGKLPGLLQYIQDVTPGRH